MNPAGVMNRRSRTVSNRINRWVYGLVRTVGSVALLGERATRGIGRRAWPQGEVLRQAYAMGNRSLLLVTVTLGFVGAVLVFEAGFQAKRIIGDLSLLGTAFIPLVLREFGPTICALMLAARVGAGIGAELGSMKVTDQLDALRMNCADPIDYLVSPRLLAGAFMCVVLAIYACAVAVATGAVTANLVYGVSYEVFLDLRLTDWGDVLTGLTKAAAYGYYIPVVAGWAGIRAEGGAAGVGRAATAAVVAGSLGVILLDAVLGGIAFVVGL